MRTFKLFSETKRLKLLKFLLGRPEKGFTIRELARETGVSPTWASKYVAGLRQIGLVKRGENGRQVLFKDSPDFRRLKLLSNLECLLSSGLLEVLVSEYNQPEAIVLFGSYSRGEDVSSSDVDLAVLTDKSLGLDLDRFSRRIGRKLSLHEIDLKKAEPEFRNTLANGVVLYGHLKVV